MSISIPKFLYKGFHGYESFCGVEIIKKPDGRHFVILTELGDNIGTSVTNAIQLIATEIYCQYLSDVPVTDIIWVEHYDENSYKNAEEPTESYSIVKLKWNVSGRYFCFPTWRPCDKKMLAEIKTLH